MRRWAFLLTLLLLLTLASSSPRESRASSAVPASSTVRPDVTLAVSSQDWTRVIVALREPDALRTPRRLDRTALKRQVSDAQERVLAGLDAGDFQVGYRYEGLAAISGQVSPAGLAKLARHADVLAVTIDSPGTSADAQSLPLIKGDIAQGLGYTGSGVTVAVIDSGVDLTHPDLSDDIVVEECFQLLGDCPVTGTARASGPGAAQDDQGHGTNVTGIITGKGTVAPIGVAPDVKIAAYKSINSSDLGFVSDWTAALSDIIANHPEVKAINMSLQSFNDFAGPCDNTQPAFTAAVNTLRAAGTVTFAAAGNHGLKHGMTFPGCISGAVAVGAVYDANLGSVSFLGCSDPVTSADRVTCFSNSDSTLDILGPGAFITSTGLGGGTSTFGGTSQATPHAVGVAALMLDANPLMTADEIEFRMKTTGVGITDLTNGRITPRLDAADAITPVDTDGDTMPDHYEAWHPCLNAAVHDAAADSDSDTFSNLGEFTSGLNPCSPDTDGDGCTETKETSAAHSTGGERDPLNPFDFFDVPAPAGPAVGVDGKLIFSASAARNKAISLQDVGVVLSFVGRVSTGVEYAADHNGDGIPDGQQVDRTPSTTPGQLWRSGPPNSAISLQDVGVVLSQVGNVCV